MAFLYLSHLRDRTFLIDLLFGGGHFTIMDPFISIICSVFFVLARTKALPIGQ